MAWRVEISPGAERQLGKLDTQHAKRILKFLHERVSVAEDPRISGKALKGQLGDYWRYRVGKYRIVCHIENEALVVLVLRVGHRKNVYHA